MAAAALRLVVGEYSCRVPVAVQDKVGQLARDFNQLALLLERNERMRRDFMADVCPTTSAPPVYLRGELEAVEDGVPALDCTTLSTLKSEVGRLAVVKGHLLHRKLADGCP